MHQGAKHRWRTPALLIAWAGAAIAVNPVWALAGEIVSESNGKCIDVRGASGAEGAQVIQFQCTGNTNQLWLIEQVADGYKILSVHSGKCLSVVGASLDRGAMVIQSRCAGDQSQLWNMVRVRNGFELVARHSGLCLNVEGGADRNGAHLIQWPCHAKPNEVWLIKDHVPGAPGS